MTHRHWKTWLGIFLAILVVGEGVAWLLWAQGSPTVSAAIAGVGRLMASAWVVRGLWLWRDLPAVQRTTAFILGTLAALLVVLFARAMGYTGLLLATLGTYCMAVGFVGGLILIRFLLSLGHPVFGVARTLIDEAIRMKVALVFIVAIVLLVPALPLALDSGELLKYRIQSFLSWSLIAVGTMLSFMTIFLAVGTITNEVNNRQIFLSLTKPVSRAQYLLGKWLGIALLNVLLVAVCGGGIYTFTQMLVQQQALTPQDREQVEQEVLAARVPVSPQPPQGMDLNALYQERVQLLRSQDPGQYGQPGSVVPPRVREQIYQQIHAQWFTIAPRQNQTYVFRNIRTPEGPRQMIQLRIKPRAVTGTPDSHVFLNIRVNDRPYAINPQQPGPISLTEDTSHILRIPAHALEDGELRLTIQNPVFNGHQQPSITFNTSDGLQILYRTGNFEGNLVRSLAMIWLRLGFLAMLGIAAGTFMGFPIASLFSLMIYIAAVASGFLHESLEEYAFIPGQNASTWDSLIAAPAQTLAYLGEGRVNEAVRLFVRLFGQAFMLVVPSFAEYNPTPLISDGLLVSWRMLTHAALQVGLLWTGFTGLVGWVIFRNRELARVTV